jgi:exopolysaccharide production protein ExoZ
VTRKGFGMRYLRALYRQLPRAGFTRRLSRVYELEPPRGGSREHQIEGMRGLSILLVFLVHWHYVFDRWAPAESQVFAFTSPLCNLGHSGVDLFFVLSGYLIYGSVITKARPFAAYLKRRVMRIYPTFLCVFALYLLLSLAFTDENKIPPGWADASYYLLLNVMLLPGIFGIEPLIGVAWSLSYEFCFYLLVPLLVALLRMRRWPCVGRCCFHLALAGLLVWGSVYASFPHVRMVMFISGILLYEVLHSFRRARALPPWADYAVVTALCLAFATVYLAASPPVHLHLSPTVTPGQAACRYSALFVGFFLLALVSFNPQGFLHRFFSWTPIRWLGNMSYSFYLIHGATLKGVALFLALLVPPTGNEPHVFVLMLFVSFASSLIASTLLFRFVEKPYSL